MGISSSYDGESETRLWVEGTFNAVTGGMIVYSVFTSFLQVDFIRPDVIGKGNLNVRLLMYFSLAFGAGVMALIGLWA